MKQIHYPNSPTSKKVGSSSCSQVPTETFTRIHQSQSTSIRTSFRLLEPRCDGHRGWCATRHIHPRPTAAGSRSQFTWSILWGVETWKVPQVFRQRISKFGSFGSLSFSVPGFISPGIDLYSTWAHMLIMDVSIFLISVESISGIIRWQTFLRPKAFFWPFLSHGNHLRLQTATIHHQQTNTNQATIRGENTTHHNGSTKLKASQHKAMRQRMAAMQNGRHMQANHLTIRRLDVVYPSLHVFDRRWWCLLGSVMVLQSCCNQRDKGGCITLTNYFLKLPRCASQTDDVFQILQNHSPWGSNCPGIWKFTRTLDSMMAKLDLVTIFCRTSKHVLPWNVTGAVKAWGAARLPSMERT